MIGLQVGQLNIFETNNLVWINLSCLPILISYINLSLQDYQQGIHFLTVVYNNTIWPKSFQMQSLINDIADKVLEKLHRLNLWANDKLE